MKGLLSIPLSSGISSSSSSISSLFPHLFRFHFCAAFGIYCIFSGSQAELGVLGVFTLKDRGRSGSSGDYSHHYQGG